MSEQINLPIIIMTAMVVSDVERRLQPIGPLPILRKPLSVTTLYHVICNELNAQRQGTIQGLTLSSFLQLLEVERKSCVLRVVAEGQVGYLYFNDGELIHAETGTQEGHAADYDILVWEGVKLQMTPLPAILPPRTLHDRLTGLLMEAFRQRDEAEEARRQTLLANSSAFSDSTALLEAAWAGAAQTAETALLTTPDATNPPPDRQATTSDLRTAEFLLTLADRLLQTPVEDTKTYAVVPELRRHIEGYALNQQSVTFLRLFDGRRTLSELLSTASSDALAFLFLIGGMRAAGLLQEVATPAD